MPMNRGISCNLVREYTEFCSVFVGSWKYISVNSSPPDVQMFLPPSNCRQVRSSNLPSAGFSDAAWSNDDQAGIYLWVWGKSVILRKFIISNVEMGINPQSASRRIASISPRRFNFPENIPIRNALMRNPSTSTVMNICSVPSNHRQLRNIRTIPTGSSLRSCRISSFSRVGKALADHPQLPAKKYELAATNNNQYESQKGLPTSIGRQFSVKSEFYIALFSIFLSLLCALLGGDALYDKRHFLGATLIIGGLLIASVGLLLFWLAYHPVVWWRLF